MRIEEDLPFNGLGGALGLWSFLWFGCIWKVTDEIGGSGSISSF